MRLRGSHSLGEKMEPSCFLTIFYLQNNEYDVSCLRRITLQTFCNEIMHNDSFAYRCIEQYMGKHVIWKVPNISSWKDYMIQLALPYKQGEIEG